MCHAKTLLQKRPNVNETHAEIWWQSWFERPGSKGAKTSKQEYHIWLKILLSDCSQLQPKSAKTEALKEWNW